MSNAEFGEAKRVQQAVDELLSREPIIQFFTFAHLPLPPPLQTLSQLFAQLAVDVLLNLPRNPERTAALRKLLEAKDCAVRAKLYKEPPR